MIALHDFWPLFPFATMLPQSSRTTLPAELLPLLGHAVVLDVIGPFVYLGVLSGGDGAFLALEETDVHDLRDTATTREEYVLTARRFGISPNRQRVLVRLADVVSVSALSDVIA